MDTIRNKLAVTKGMQQECYAVIQNRIQDDIRKLKKEYKDNKDQFVSCKNCNLIFHKDVLIDGICYICAEHSKNNGDRRKKVKIDFSKHTGYIELIFLDGSLFPICPNCGKHDAMVEEYPREINMLFFNAEIVEIYSQ